MASLLTSPSDLTALYFLLKGEWEANPESTVAWKAVRRQVAAVVLLRFLLAALATAGQVWMIHMRWGGSGFGGFPFMLQLLDYGVGAASFLLVLVFPFLAVPAAWRAEPAPRAPGERALGILAAMVVAGMCVGAAWLPTMLATQLERWILLVLHGDGAFMPGWGIFPALLQAVPWALMEAIAYGSYCGAVGLRRATCQLPGAGPLAMSPIVAWYGGMGLVCCWCGGAWGVRSMMLPLGSGWLAWASMLGMSLVTKAMGSLVLCVVMTTFWRRDLEVLRGQVGVGR